MKQKKKILSPYKRKIHIDEEEWTYQIKKSWLGKSFVKVCSPDRTKKWELEVGELGNSYMAYASDDINFERVFKSREDWKAMTPAHVKRLIEKRILGREIDR